MRRENHRAVATKARPTARPVPSGRCAIRLRSNADTTHNADSLTLSGDRMPDRLDWAATVTTNPVTRARTLPAPASTRTRLAQPRARIMPMPNISPPMTAPDKVPGVSNWRMPWTGRLPVSISA